MLRVNSLPEIALGVFPKAECPGIGNFRAKNENQNSPAELAQRYGMPPADIGNDIGKRERKGWLALASCDRNEATTCAQDQREARRNNEPNKKGAPKGALAWLNQFTVSIGEGSTRRAD